MKKTLGFIIAILIASAIIAIAHAVIYEAVLGMATPLLVAPISSAVSTALAWILGILAFSFMAGTFISMKYNTAPVRVFYTFSAVWTGFAIYFFFAAFAYGVLGIFFPGFPVTIAWVGVVFVATAFCAGVYGIFNANTIRLTEVPVSVPGLPASWKHRKAVWVSDVHLGQVRSRSFAKKVADRILSLHPDIVFVGGDLYDGSKVDERAIVEPFRVLCGTDGQYPVPLGVYFIMGNHEEFHEGDEARFAAAVRGIGMKFLDDEMTEVEGMQIIGVDHGNTDSAEKFASVLGKISAGGSFDPVRPSILLKHEPRDLGIGAGAGISFQISGHTHRGQIFPVSWITRLTFRGFDYGLKKYTHPDGKVMQVYTSSGVGTSGPPLRVGTRSEIVLFTFTGEI